MEFKDLILEKKCHIIANIVKKIFPTTEIY